MERLDHQCQFGNGLKRKCLSDGGRTNGERAAVAGYLLCEEYLGRGGRHEHCDGDIRRSGYYPDIRILEYSGIDPVNPVDVVSGRPATAATSGSGAVTTTNSTDLLVGANTVLSMTTSPVSGFAQRLLTDPDGDIAEDRLVTATGTYTAAASLSFPNGWVMQMVAFRAADLRHHERL